MAKVDEQPARSEFKAVGDAAQWTRLHQKFKKRLRILRLADVIGETSGPYNQFVLPWVDKHDIAVCTFFSTNFSVCKDVSLFSGDGTIRGFYNALQRALDKTDYDVLHIHSQHAAVFYLAGMMFMRNGISLAQSMFTLHTSFGNCRTKHKLMLMPIMFFFQKIVCCSRASFDSVPKLYRGLSGNRLSAIPNGVDLDRIDKIVKAVQKPPLRRPFTAITVGRLIKSKHPQDVLKAFGHCASQEAKLIFVGEGNLRSKMISTVTELGLPERVELTGQIPREKVYERLVEADLFVSASAVEGMPVGVLEAMAIHCPVILSDIAPHREIAAGVDFIPLVKVADTVGLSREIDRFQKMSLEHRADIGQKCRKLVEDRFSLKAMQAEYEKLYSQLHKRTR